MLQVREVVIVSAQITAEERAELERRALEADRSLSAEIRRALRAHLESTHDKETAA
jgi:hypothetical protein